MGTIIQILAVVLTILGLVFDYSFLFYIGGGTIVIIDLIGMIAGVLKPTFPLTLTFICYLFFQNFIFAAIIASLIGNIIGLIGLFFNRPEY